MRRDPEYQIAYKKYFNDDGTIKSKDKIREMLFLFAREFHILWPIPPGISFLVLRKNGSRKSKRAIDNIYDQLTFWTDGVLGSRKIRKAQEVGLTKEEINRITSIIRMYKYGKLFVHSPKRASWRLSPGPKTGEIDINIDISAPLGRILAAVKDEIFYTKKFLNREKEPRGSGKTGRRNKQHARVNKFSEYLTAYIEAGDTLVEKDRLPVATAAKKIYPKEYKEADGDYPKRKKPVDSESLNKRVRGRIAKAVKYIRGFYRQIE